MQTSIELKIKEIKTLIDTAHSSNKWADYDSLEYELYLLSSMVYDYETIAQKSKLSFDEMETKKYVEISTVSEGAKEMSEAAKKRQLEIVFMDRIRGNGDIQADVDRYKNYLKSFSRIADHFRSGFIKEMAEAKRNDMVINKQ